MFKLKHRSAPHNQIAIDMWRNPINQHNKPEKCLQAEATLLESAQFHRTASPLLYIAVSGGVPQSIAGSGIFLQQQQQPASNGERNDEVSTQAPAFIIKSSIKCIPGTLVLARVRFLPGPAAGSELQLKKKYETIPCNKFDST